MKCFRLDNSFFYLVGFCLSKSSSPPNPHMPGLPTTCPSEGRRCPCGNHSSVSDGFQPRTASNFRQHKVFSAESKYIENAFSFVLNRNKQRQIEGLCFFKFSQMSRTTKPTIYGTNVCTWADLDTRFV